MKKTFALTLLLLSGISIATLGQETRLLLIGIDGCRASALTVATTPNLDNLMQTGYYTLNGLTGAPTWSGVGWTSMMTGVWKDKHGVNDNSYIGQDLNYKHFFKYVNDQHPQLAKYSIVHWGPINTHLANFSAGEQQFTYGTDLEVENKVVDVLTNEDPDVIFVHFDDVDHAGHADGFTENEPGYISAIELVDGQVGSILTALYARADYANENWLIMISTDHGGNESGHGGASPEERTIFIIASGAVDDLGQVTVPETVYSGAAHVETDGSSGAYLNAGDPTGNLIIGSNDLTVECWVRTNGWSSDPSIISNKDWNSGFNSGFILAGTTNGSTWKFNIGSGIVRYDLDGGSINDGEWHHLAVTVDRGNTIKAYQDGILTDEATIIGAIDVDSDLDLCFGQDGTTTYSASIDMGLSEVRIWNAALSEQAILDYMCMELDGSHPFAANLVGHWPLTEGTGVSAQDLSGSNDAQLVGNTTWATSGSDRTCYDLSSTPEMVDIAYTALTHLCVEIDPLWELDGQSFGVNPCSPVGIVETAARPLNSMLVTDGNLDLQFDAEQKMIGLYDTQGRSVGQGSGSSFQFRLPSKGLYVLRSLSDQNEWSLQRIVSQ